MAQLELKDDGIFSYDGQEFKEFSQEFQLWEFYKNSPNFTYYEFYDSVILHYGEDFLMFMCEDDNLCFYKKIHREDIEYTIENKYC